MATSATLLGRVPLPPLVGLKMVVVSAGLERAYDRARSLDVLGYRMAACGDPHSAAALIAEFQPEAVVVDCSRENCPPDELCVRVRRATMAPIVVVGNSGSLDEMSRCYDAGADIYCRPGTGSDEMDLRVRALLRRMEMASGVPHVEEHPEPLQVGELEIDTAAQLVRKRGVAVGLSPTEFRLLAALAEHRGSVIPSRALIARVWGNQYANETHYLRLYIRYLRQKLEDDPSHPRYIVNRWGSGYALEWPRAA